MAFATINCFSEVLEVGISLSVVLPQATEAQIGVGSAQRAGDPPLLYLLHGLSDDHSAWPRYTSIERYADERGLAVVMPAVGRSFYADERCGHRYWSFVSEELPSLVSGFFRVTDDPAKTFVAGLSMGGYGALKLALSHPQRYAAAASLSGVADLRTLLERGERAEILQRVFGGEVRADEDLFALLDAAELSALPRLWVGCGTEDHLLQGNLDFVARAQAAGATITSDFRPGDHTWDLWDALLPTVLDFLLDQQRQPAAGLPAGGAGIPAGETEAPAGDRVEAETRA